MRWKSRVIYWGHDEEQEVICRGHVDSAAYARACRILLGDGEEEAVTHLWARWVPSVGQFERTLHMCDGPGRGAFAFTIRSAAL